MKKKKTQKTDFGVTVNSEAVYSIFLNVKNDKKRQEIKSCLFISSNVIFKIKIMRHVVGYSHWRFNAVGHLL